MSMQSKSPSVYYFTTVRRVYTRVLQYDSSSFSKWTILNFNFRSTVTVIGATKDDGGNKGKTWGSDFEIREAIDAYQCKHEELATRAFDKYALPKAGYQNDASKLRY